MQYLHIAPCGLELQEEESNYCIKENPEKWGEKEIKEKPQPFMLLWPLDMAIHEFTAVEQRLWWFYPECQASISLGGTCFSDPSAWASCSLKMVVQLPLRSSLFPSAVLPGHAGLFLLGAPRRQ